MPSRSKMDGNAAVVETYWRQSGLLNVLQHAARLDQPAPNPLDRIKSQWRRPKVAEAVLHETDRAEFGYLRDALNLTNGNLSRHLRTLEQAGYIEIHKGHHGRRPRTWLSLTTEGSRALAEELAALRDLVARLDGTTESK